MFEEPAAAGVGQLLNVGIPGIDEASMPDDTISAIQLSLSASPPRRSNGEDANERDCRNAGPLWHVADLHFVT